MYTAVKTDGAPGAIGPYSQAIRTGDFVFVSGQIPIDPKTGEFSGTDILSQTRQCLTNMKEILKAAGTDMSKVVKTTVLLKNMEDFGDMNGVYAEYFTEPYPARAAFQVGTLPKDALVEIECVAVI